MAKYDDFSASDELKDLISEVEEDTAKAQKQQEQNAIRENTLIRAKKLITVGEFNIAKSIISQMEQDDIARVGDETDARVYWCYLLIDVGATSNEDIIDGGISISDNKYYKLAINTARGEELDEYLKVKAAADGIAKANAKKAKEEEVKKRAQREIAEREDARIKAEREEAIRLEEARIKAENELKLQEIKLKREQEKRIQAELEQKRQDEIAQKIREQGEIDSRHRERERMRMAKAKRKKTIFSVCSILLCVLSVVLCVIFGIFAEQKVKPWIIGGGIALGYSLLMCFIMFATKGDFFRFLFDAIAMGLSLIFLLTNSLNVLGVAVCLLGAVIINSAGEFIKIGLAKGSSAVGFADNLCTDTESLRLNILFTALSVINLAIGLLFALLGFNNLTWWFSLIAIAIDVCAFTLYWLLISYIKRMEFLNVIHYGVVIPFRVLVLAFIVVCLVFGKTYPNMAIYALGATIGLVCEGILGAITEWQGHNDESGVDCFGSSWVVGIFLVVTTCILLFGRYLF